MGLKEWAKREIEMACKKERPDRKESEWDYGCACYESALKAFNSLVDDGHSGMSIGLTKQILNRLIDGKPLTPIEDTDDVWNYLYFNADKGCSSYQCKRMASLFKKVYVDGTVKYNDTGRFVCFNIESPEVAFHNNFIAGIVEGTVGEITMPYMPNIKPMKIYVFECLVDPQFGDYDTIGILHYVDFDGKTKPIGRYFKETEYGFVEIDLQEYLDRYERRIDMRPLQ